jgi:alpha-galactosidase
MWAVHTGWSGNHTHYAERLATGEQVVGRGELIRMQLPDPSLDLHGVVAADRSRGIFGFTAVGRSKVVSRGRLRFAGLDPQRRYRVTPLMIDYPPIGLRPPLWWGVEQEPVDQYAELAAASRVRYRVQAGGQLGIELPGAMLMEVGLAAALVHPEHMVLYQLVAVD